MYLHPTTSHFIEIITEQTPQALLVTGQFGSGLSITVEQLVKNGRRQVIMINPQKNDVADDTGNISIEVIRHLYEQTKAVTTAGLTVVIRHADAMGLPAQNAFLKLLEEPPQRVNFVLTSYSPDKLLPTILSRVQTITVLPISSEQSNRLLDELAISEAVTRRQLLFIASGKPALLHTLVTNPEFFKQTVVIITDARKFVTGSPYDRLTLAYAYKDSSPRALDLLQYAGHMLRQTVADSGDASQLSVLSRLTQTRERIIQNGNVRLQLSSLAML